MFRDLSARKVPGVLDYQGSALDEYVSRGVNAPQVALQMPTGSGKTLIGLLVAEWRRRKFGERTLYLCPTNQLARQVFDHAREKYGISPVRFKGPKIGYHAEDKAAFETADALAVTSYSALFNSNPYFEPTFIVLDDCHVAENYIGSLWSLEIGAADFPDVFERVARFFKEFVTRQAFHSLTESSASAFDRSWADMVPIMAIVDRHAELMNILDDATEDTTLFHRWSMIRPSLLACNIFIGWQRILIKPLIPPTMTFRQFAASNQRLFMSATLGEAGNFERMTGVGDVIRLQTPTQLSKEAVGRRFFLFPGQSLDPPEQQRLALSLMRKAGRSVLLVPSRDAAAETDIALQKAGLSVFSIENLEENKKPFTSANNAVALLAGRYDGLDFPDDDARLLTINGMPTTFELQELFLRNKAHAAPMLEDRTRNRIIQATGRCTRSENDYSAVLVLDDKLIKAFRVGESRSLLPQEIQAEVSFGLDQAREATAETIGQQFAAFLEHRSDWEEAEEQIRGFRAEAVVTQLPFHDDLKSSAVHEVGYTYAMWQQKYAEALSFAKSVIDSLTASDLRGYKGFWELQAATAAKLATACGQGNYEDQVTHMISRASKGLVSVDWLLRLAGTSLVTGAERKPTDSAAILIENLAMRFESMGISTNIKFNAHIANLREEMTKSDATDFEHAVLTLGSLLGYEAGKIQQEGTPDPWWLVGDEICFVFEVHSAATKGKIGSAKSRQAALQDRYVREKLDLPKEAEVISVLLSDGRPDSEASSIYLTGTCLWPLADFRKWASACVDAVSDLRLGYSYTPDLRWRMRAAETYVALGIDPQSLRRRCEDMRWHHA